MDCPASRRHDGDVLASILNEIEVRFSGPHAIFEAEFPFLDWEFGHVSFEAGRRLRFTQVFAG
jgi:hypothetical protein